LYYPPLGREPFDFLDIPYKKSVWAKSNSSTLSPNLP